MIKDKVKHLRAALPDAIRTARKRTRRSIIRLWLNVARADQEKRLRAERALRGREQLRLLQRSDAVVVSYAKSGRTWLRVMISRLYQQIYELPDDTVLEFDNFHHMDRRIPCLFFTHDEYIREFTGNTGTKVDFYGKKVLFMVRDPRDVAVSQFFHWRYRTKPWKRGLNFHPSNDTDCTLFDFVLGKSSGLPRVIDFMNTWAREIGKTRAHEIVRYEDMRNDPQASMTRVARFLDIPASDNQIREAVAYAAYENMKQKESEQSFRSSGARLTPGDKANPDSYKVRRAKVGGYRDYFDDTQLAEIDAMTYERLDPVFDYGKDDLR